tara:strand:- start:155 stop:460 length:306 start_codon:yes stop_codon:yes gene_type:complete
MFAYCLKSVDIQHQTPSSEKYRFLTRLNMKYTRNRVLAKSFVWRIIATLTGALVTFLLTGEIETAGMFIVIEFPLKMIIYYAHERGWEAISWGKEKISVST